MKLGLILVLGIFAVLSGRAAEPRAGHCSWRIYTHSLGDEAFMSDGHWHAQPHAGKRAFYLKLVEALMQSIGQDCPIEQVAFARGLDLVHKSGRVMFFNVTMTVGRREEMSWVGPILAETSHLYQWRTRPTPIGTLEEARKWSICVLNGNLHDSFLTANGFSKLIRHPTYAGCFKLLAAGRVDLVASSDLGLEAKAREANIPAGQLQMTPVSIPDSDSGIAISPDVNPEDIKALNDALGELKKNGDYDRLLTTYLE